ncbi:hypothetical protein Y032_0013g2092 [Ancylostoma ceylanicum]|uniref:Uncharacterized protein n=1 Tax=Ancylostoma ceylanicum TaxID=53326 RepID=A0A016VCI2_9BILA|nr:hypothetical protein Y032_0013g2092 [Ancylostoma ceylanicum]
MRSTLCESELAIFDFASCRRALGLGFAVQEKAKVSDKHVWVLRFSGKASPHGLKEQLTCDGQLEQFS